MLDPFMHGDESDDVENYMHRAMMRMGELPAWHYERGRNIVLFTMTKKHMPEWVKLLTAIFAAVVCSLLVRLTLFAGQYLADPVYCDRGWNYDDRYR